MESFYGGRPGFSFVLKGEYENVEALVQAISKGELKYGEYALITDPERKSNEHGNIYRVTSSKNSTDSLQLIGNVTTPAPLYALNLSESIDNGTEIAWIPVPGYEDDTGIYNDTVKGIYTIDTDTNVIGLGFSFPYTVIDLDLNQSTAAPAITNHFDADHPFYQHYNLSLPYGNVAISKESEIPDLSAGGIWLVVEDG